jgi:hypothetical protein
MDPDPATKFNVDPDKQYRYVMHLRRVPDPVELKAHLNKGY